MAVPHLQLEQFSGPLDLLLSLIQDEKLDITEIALSGVTEQYLAYLEKIDEKDPNELADFLVVATRLLLLKSRALLPQLAMTEDEGPSLEAQLRLYKVFVDASKKMNRLWLAPARGVWRVEPPRKADAFVPPANVTLARLHGVMVQLVHRLRPPKALPHTTIDRSISIKEKIETIRSLLARARHVSFHEVISQSQNRTEIIISFMALLELMKLRAVALTQEEHFGDIIVERLE